MRSGAALMQIGKRGLVAAQELSAHPPPLPAASVVLGFPSISAGRRWPQTALLLTFDQSKRVSADLKPSAVFVGAAIEAGARLIHLPPYSPDFNPIENAFSKIESAPAIGRRKNGRRTMER